MIEANNELYRKMAQLLQWSDQVSTLHQLIENGDARIGTSSVSNTSNQGSPSPERADTDGASLSSTPTEATPKPSPPQSREVAKAANIKKAHEVSRDLLESFEVSASATHLKQRPVEGKEKGEWNALPVCVLGFALLAAPMNGHSSSIARMAMSVIALAAHTAP